MKGARVAQKPSNKRNVHKGSSFSKHKQLRHQHLGPSIEKEVQLWAKSVADYKGSKAGVFDCPFCGLKTHRHIRMSRHAKSHVTGKMASMWKNLSNKKDDTHPRMSQVMRALFNHDASIGKMKGDYMARASALLRKWTSFSTQVSSIKKTLLTHIGRKDEKLRLVFTEDGPEYWLRSDAKLKQARAFGTHFYTMGFANAFFRHLFQHGGKLAPAMRAQRADWARIGCEVCHLANIHSETMCTLAVDLMESKAFNDYLRQKKINLAAKGEYESLSADSTYKLAVKVEGHTSSQNHNYLTVVGFHGCPLAIECGKGEAIHDVRSLMAKVVPPKCKELVKHMSFDTASGKLHRSMTSLFTNLHGISLDSVHPSMAVDRCMQKGKSRKSLVGLVTRSIMGKFEISDKARSQEPVFTGVETLTASEEEKKLHQNILDGDMPKKNAKSILKAMNPNTGMSSRVEFVRLIAALVAMYPEKMDTKLDKTTLRKSLAAMTQPQRAEWYLNNTRYRSRLTVMQNKALGTGTSRNEQLHSTLNRDYAQTVRISQRMLNAQLQTWLAGEMTVFLRAMESNSTVGVRRVDLRPMVFAGICLFTSTTWTRHVASPRSTWTSGAKSQRTARMRRCGTAREQESVYQTIRKKMTPRKRATVYARR